MFLECGIEVNLHVYFHNWTHMDFEVSSREKLTKDNLFNHIQVINNETYVKGGKKVKSFRESLVKPKKDYLKDLNFKANEKVEILFI